MRVHFVLAAGLVAVASSSVAQEPTIEGVEPEVEHLWQIAHADRPPSEQYLDRRIADVAFALVGRRYERSPLGEGSGVDSDPRLRLDAFDCTTFIETVAAIALAEAPEQVAAKLDELRYDGREPTFENRLHLMAAQWVPAWQRRGVLRPMDLDQFQGIWFGDGRGLSDSESVTPDPAPWRSSVVLDITPEDLARARADWMAGGKLPTLPWEELPTGQFELPIVLLDEGGDAFRLFSDSLVLQVVRQPRPGRPWVVTHQALVVRKRVDDRWVSRVVHASSVRGEVVEVTMDQFLAAQRAAKRWPVVGINVQVWGETQPRWVLRVPPPASTVTTPDRAAR